jgi:hypothetical protein
MSLWIVYGFLFLALPGTPLQSQPSTNAQSAPGIAGAWVLNPALSQTPGQVGFDAEWARAAGEGAETGRPEGRGRRGGSRSGGSIGTGPQVVPESADDSTRVQQLTAEVRTPPVHLTIVQGSSSVSIADDQGLSRTFHPNGALENLTIGTVPLPTTARWDSDALVVVYDVESERQVRYTYTPSANPTRLVVDIRFVDRKKEGDEVRLTYEPPDAQNRAILLGARSPAAAPAVPGASPSSAASTTAASARPPVLPPGSELRGLSTIAVDVEDLNTEAAACGLDQAKIKSAVSQILVGGGLKLQTSGQEDADLVVSVSTSRLPNGTCVSRYDASVVAYADATLPYVHGTVAAVQVQLLHDGGMAGGSPAAHASAIMNALTKSASQFVEEIRAANKSAASVAGKTGLVVQRELARRAAAFTLRTVRPQLVPWVPEYF